MHPTRLQLAADRRSRLARRNLADQLRQMADDAGVTERELAAAAGLGQASVCRILDGTQRPSVETYGRLAAALGTDLSIRLYPNTGPAVRDRLSAPMLEAVLGALDRRWRPFTEVPVRTALPGVDRPCAPRCPRSNPRRERAPVGAAPPGAADPLACGEGRLTAKLGGWAKLGEEPQVSRLLIVRRTRATRAVAEEFGQQLRLAYPAHPDDALAALTTPTTPWPGAALLWAEVAGSKARLLAGR